ncbi:MAG: diacylglycerol kinase family protein [Thermoanaerobaculia bacterium]
MNARILLNAASGRGRGGRRRAAIETLARRHGLPLEVPASAAEVTLRARAAADEGVERLLVCGGDGTWHHAARGLAGTACALAPIALGTGNDLAREFGLPLDAERAIPIALAAPIAAVDLTRAGPLVENRICCGVAGAGFDSLCAEYAKTITRLRGPLVYVASVLQVLRTFRPLHAVLEHDGGCFEGGVMFVSLANTSTFGGGMRIAPRADPADGLIDVVIAKEISRAHLLAVFPLVYLGRHFSDAALQTFRTRRARLAFDRPTMLYGDGEAIAPVPADAKEAKRKIGEGGSEWGLEVQLDPGALRVVRPGR